MSFSEKGLKRLLIAFVKVEPGVAKCPLWVKTKKTEVPFRRKPVRVLLSEVRYLVVLLIQLSRMLHAIFLLVK
jgi:hypothetical protein